MKKYFVARTYESLNPSIVFSTDIKKDAEDYAAIMRRSEGREFIVLTMIVGE